MCEHSNWTQWVIEKKVGYEFQTMCYGGGQGSWKGTIRYNEYNFYTCETFSNNK